MTMALCLNCGESKFGAICPCTKCGAGSTGDMSLDIAFSDHNLSAKTMGDFGEVIRALATRSHEPPVRFWAFIKFISDNHPSILRATPPPEFIERVERILALGPLPIVTLQASPEVQHRENIRQNTFEIALPLKARQGIISAFRRPASSLPAFLKDVLVFYRVDVRLTDNRVYKGFRLAADDKSITLSRPDKTCTFGALDIQALRRSFAITQPFCARPWIPI